MFDEQTAKEILAIPIKRQNPNDELAWTGTKCGNFSVKNGYDTLRQESANKAQQVQPSTSYQIPKSLWIAFWNLQTCTKVKIFLWSLCQNAIPSKENLWKRNILADPVCDSCRREVKTVEHIFLRCHWTELGWSDPSLKTQNLT